MRRQVDDDRDYGGGMRGGQPAEPDFDRKFSAVAAPAEEFMARETLACRPRQEIAAAVCCAAGRGDDYVEGLPEELPTRVAELLLGPGVASVMRPAPSTTRTPSGKESATRWNNAPGSALVSAGPPKWCATDTAT